MCITELFEEIFPEHTPLQEMEKSGEELLLLQVTENRLAIVNRTSNTIYLFPPFNPQEHV